MDVKEKVFIVDENTLICGHCGKPIIPDEYKTKDFDVFYKGLSEFEKDEVDLLQNDICYTCFYNDTKYFEDVVVEQITNEDLKYTLTDDEISELMYRPFSTLLVENGCDVSEIIKIMKDQLEYQFGDYGYFYFFNSRVVRNDILEITLLCKPINIINLDVYEKSKSELRRKLWLIKSRYGIEFTTKITNNQIELILKSPFESKFFITSFLKLVDIENYTFDMEYYTPAEKEKILSYMILEKVNSLDVKVLELIAEQA